MRPVGSIRLVLAAVLALMAGMASGQSGEVEPPEERDLRSRGATTIAVFNTTASSGAFVGLVNGNVALHETRMPVVKSSDVPLRNIRIRSLNPSGMVFNNALLYVYKGSTRAISVLDPFGRNTRPKRLEGTLDNPRMLAVSPQGLFATMDGGRLTFLQETHKPVRHETRFPDARGLVFSSWDMLHVLHGEKITTVELVQEASGDIRFIKEAPIDAEPPGDEHWRAMDAMDGILYLATSKQVYARVGDQLIAVLPDKLKIGNIRDIGITRNGIYLLNGERVTLAPRATVVDFVLVTDASSARAALIDIHRYLAERSLLPQRKVRAGHGYAQLRDMLTEHIALPDGVNAPPVQAQELAKWNALMHVLAQRSDEQEPGRAERKLSLLVEAGDRKRMPALRLESDITRVEIELDRPLGQILDERVRSVSLRAQITPGFIRRLNDHLAGHSDEAVLATYSGRVTLPVESWSVTAAVPAAEFADEKSALWQLLAKYPGVSLRQQFAVPGQSSSMNIASVGALHSAATAAEQCESLKKSRRQLLEAIGSLNSAANEDPAVPLVAKTGVRIGVLESSSATNQNHPVFAAAQNHEVWHVLSGSFNELVPVVFTPTIAASMNYPKGEFALDHHGTHVSALIAGRPGSCWSGLAEAKLVLIDTAVVGGIQKQIDKAADEGVKVFNVSQSFKELTYSLIKELRDIFVKNRALAVVAAGNDATDLNDDLQKTVSTTWGSSQNVIVVGASGKNRQLWSSISAAGEKKGSNFGRRQVDLIAPGEDVDSAVADDAFAPASGTSQAAPLVAAAAAILVDKNGYQRSPQEAKARLIATAAWDESYFDKVWGGRLDFSAAVDFPNYHVIRTVNGVAPGERHFIEPANNPKVQILSPTRTYERSGQASSAPDQIRFDRILSLRRSEIGGAPVYRIAYKDDSENMKILLDTRIEDEQSSGGPVRIACKTYQRVEDDGRLADEDCGAGISIVDIDTYFRGQTYDLSEGGVQ